MQIEASFIPLRPGMLCAFAGYMDIAALNDQINFHRIMQEHELRIPRSRGAYRPSFRRAAPAPRGAMQRVSVKTYYFKPEKRNGFVSYMEQEGKGKDGTSPELFTEDGKNIEDALHAEYPEEERFYKIILSPENGDRLDMERYTKDFMKSFQQSEGKEFKWAASVHYDTEHPHAHILVRGVDESGKEVNLSRDTIKYGMRGQASRLATMELGHRTEAEIAQQKQKELHAERLTQLDKTIKEKLDRESRIKPKTPEEKSRLTYLSSIGMAEQNRNGSFTVDGKFDQKLKYLQRDNDILKTVYGKEAKLQDKDFIMYRKGWTVDGVIIKKGIENEMTEKSYALVQDKHGKKYYVSDRQLNGFKTGDKIHISGVKEDEKTKTVISPSREPEKSSFERGR
jgi:hypothetical protein